MAFHERSAALAVLWAHLKEEALDSKFPHPVKGSEDLHMGQTDEAAVSSKGSCHGYIPTLMPSRKTVCIGFCLAHHPC